MLFLPNEKIYMNAYFERIQLKDNGGRRSGADRRQFSYTFHIPERRSGMERRAGKDRRKEPRYGSVLIDDM